MREPIENVSLLQKQINDLQLENQILKNILDRSGISYIQEINRLKVPEKAEAYDPNQGARIIHPNQITEDMANLFYARFWGRQDVYEKEVRKRIQAKPVILLNVTISGRSNAQKNTNRK